MIINLSIDLLKQNTTLKLQYQCIQKQVEFGSFCSMNWIFAMLIALLLFFEVKNFGTTVNWVADPGFVVSSYQIITPNQFAGRAAALTNYVSPTYASIPLSNIRILFGINSFQVNGSTLSFSLKIAPYSITNTQYKFSVSILNQTVIYKLRIDSALLDISIPDFQYEYRQITFQALNKNQGYRSENITIPIKSTFNQAAGQIKQALFLQGYNVFNRDGLTLYLSYSTTVLNKTHYSLMFIALDQNIIDFVNFAFIAIDKSYYEGVRYQRKMLLDFVVCPGATCPGTGGWIPDPIFVNAGHMLFGIQYVYFRKHQSISYNLQTTSLNDLTVNYDFVGLYGSYISIFSMALRQCITLTDYFDPADSTCKGSCALSVYSYQNSINSVCVKCHYSCSSGTCIGEGISDCTACSASKSRVASTVSLQFDCICPTGYFDNGIELCYYCPSYIKGCLQCTSINVCTQCSAGLKVGTNGLCVCLDPTQSQTRYGQCFDLVACISYYTAPNGTKLCIQCNAKSNFILKNYQCVCNDGFSFSYQIDGVTPICIEDPEVCGNGIRTISQLCDDNNNVNYDGCDQNCKIEVEFLCFGDLRNTSYCVQRLTKLEYIGTMKMESQTMAESYFSIQPYDPKLNNIKTLPNHLQSSLSSLQGSLDIFYTIYKDINQDRLIIKIKFSYSKDIDSKVMQFLAFEASDSSNSFKTQTNFNLEGQNLDLLIQEGYENYTILDYVILALIFACFLIVLFSIFKSETWIGIEVIHTFQFSFFYFLLFQKIDRKQVRFLDYLQLINGYNVSEQKFDYFEYLKFDEKLYLMSYQKQMLLNFNYTGFLLLIPALLLIIKLILKLVRKCNSKNVKKTLNPNLKLNLQNLQSKSTLNKIINFLSCKFIIGKIYISINLLFMNQVIFSFFIESSNLSEGEVSNIQLQQIFTVFFMINVLLTIGLLKIAALKGNDFHIPEETQSKFIQFKRFSPSYPFCYTIFQVLKICLLTLLYTYHFAAFVILSLDVMYLFCFIFVRPYQKQIQKEQHYCYILHNLHNIWNCLGLISFTILIIVENKNVSSDQDQQNASIRFILLTIWILSLIFAILRLFGSKKIAQMYQQCSQNNEQNKKYSQVFVEQRKNPNSSIKKRAEKIQKMKQKKDKKIQIQRQKLKPFQKQLQTKQIRDSQIISKKPKQTPKQAEKQMQKQNSSRTKLRKQIKSLKKHLNKNQTKQIFLDLHTK